jgi:predicted metal-dependent peptidase
MANPIETKLAAARTRLILDKPFLGALVLRLPMKAADWCETTATDARAFYFNPRYIQALSLGQTQFMLAHEALHCALSHFARRQHRVKWKWDLACDFAVNPLLVSEGLSPPPDAVVLKEYEGMTAEEIYPLLDQFDEEDKPLDEHVYDEPQESAGQGGAMRREREPERDSDGSPEGGEPTEGEEGDGASRPPPLSHDEREQLAVQWSQRLAGAAQQAMQAGKLGGSLARLVDHLLQPQLPWRVLLARYMTATARDDYNYQRPSRREGNAILPSLRSQEVDIVIALDTSGSISPREMEEFVSEIDAIKGQVRARITLVACDAALCEQGPWEFEAWEALRLPDEIAGGGGTSFKPVFEWLDRTGRRPDLVVYFTDAEGSFPESEPDSPVIWLVKGRGKVPWGERIQLN